MMGLDGGLGAYAFVEDRKARQGQADRHDETRSLEILLRMVYWMTPPSMRSIADHAQGGRFAQAAWISIVDLPAWLINSLPSSGISQQALGWKGILGTGIWTIGFALEAVADTREC